MSSEITEEFMKELFTKLRTEENDNKGSVRFDVVRYFNSLQNLEEREANMLKFMEVGGHNFMAEQFLCDDIGTVDAVVGIFKDIYFDTYSSELSEFFAGEAKCVDRFVELFTSETYAKWNTLQLDALNVARALTSRISVNRKQLTERLLPVLVGQILPETCDHSNRMQAMLMLCNLVGDSEDPEHLKLIESHQSLVEILVPALGDPFAPLGGGYCQLKDVVISLLNLARVDANKRLLLKFGMVNAVVQTLGDSNRLSSSWEVIKVLQLLVLLSFEKAAVKALVRKGALKQIDKLFDTYSGNAEVQEQIQLARWLLQRVAPTGYRATTQPGDEHVLISYSCAQQEQAQKLADLLKQRNVNVWLRADHDNDHSLQSILQAVDNASVLVACVSGEYKRCAKCHLEAQYALQSKKTIVAVAAQPDVRFDGWLTPSSDLEIVLGDLSNEELLKQTADRVHNAVERHVQLFETTAVNWKACKVGKWLSENGFGDVAATFVDEQFDGLALQEFAKADLQFFENRTKLLGIRKFGRAMRLHALLSQLFA